MKKPIVDEALVTFGYAYMDFCIWLWNLQISFPDEGIYILLLLIYSVVLSACSKNPGIFNADGTEQPSQHNIHAGDNLMADTKRRLPFALAAAI